MGGFNPGKSNRFGRDGGGGGFGGRDRRPDFQKKSWGGQGGGDRNRPMHQATCSDCGNTCEVPFRPTGDRPVYCNDCFGDKKNAGEGRNEGRPSFAQRKDFGKDFGNKSFAKPSFESNKGNDETKKLLEVMNVKLDRLIKAMDNFVASKNISAPATVPVQKKEEIAATAAPVSQGKEDAKKAIIKKEIAKVVAKKVAKKKK